jgi:TPR repeat protein
MKQTLHWNVSGIPPEARDAARAAATKEGLSVGDWLTKRILADRAPAAPAPGADSETPTGPRLVGLESETESSAPRIDDGLRMLADRMESSERAQNEIHRLLSEATRELQSTNRSQAEALQRIGERVDRIERNGDAASMRDAMRGLHHAVARLTEQIGKTTGDSAGQIAVLATSLEAMAVKIAAAREQSVRLERSIEERLNGFADAIRELDARVLPLQREPLSDARLDAAEARLSEAVSQQYATVSRNLEALALRLEAIDSTRDHGAVQEAIATLSRRFEATERRSKDMVAALQASVAEISARVARFEAPVTGEQNDNGHSPVQVESSVSAPAIDAWTPVVIPAGDADEETRSDAPGPLDYLAQARRAAQASGDANLPNPWQVPGADVSEEGNRFGRAAIRIVLLVLVMCAGFLLMRFFGPHFADVQPPTVNASALAGGPEFRALQARANLGSPAAELLLGLRFADGVGVPADYAEAARWLERAANKGEALAQYRLATLYEKGLGVPPDRRVAADWYAKAAQLGNLRAMHNLAIAFANGAGREKDFSEAARWFQQAAERGLSDSQFNLAVLYERGLGVDTSLAEAYKWYAIAASLGDTESATRVEALVSQIPAAQRAAADKAAQTFKAAPSRGEANEAPALAQVLS